MKWKDRLLSSSLPLEYEVAKILAKNNFAVDFDYAYKRLDSSLEKEFSIDIKASGYYPFRIDSSIKMQIDLLVECKYRNPNVSWLFVEDINITEFSNFSSKGVIKLIDEFSEYYTKNKAFGIPICERCLKGVEVNMQSGDVHDQGINHGINQLIYSMPVLLQQHIFGTLVSHLSDIYPYILCPILITTADLRIVKNNFSIDNLNNAQKLDDISVEVPYLKIYSDVYPSFEEHCKNVFKDILDHDSQGHFENFVKLRKIQKDKNGKYNYDKLYSNTERFLAALQHGFESDTFRETIICNFKSFPSLLKEIKNGITTIGRNLTKIKPVK